LLSDASQTAIGYMGTTLLAVLATLVVAAVPLLIRWIRDGFSAVKTHWKQNAALSFGTALIVWICLFLWALVNQVYNDHVTAWRLINGNATNPGLPAQIISLNLQIDGPHGFEAQIAELRNELEAAQTAAIANNTGTRSSVETPQEEKQRKNSTRELTETLASLIEQGNAISQNFAGTDNVSQIEADYNLWDQRVEKVIGDN